MEWQQPEPRNRVRPANRKVFLSLGKLRRLGAGRPGQLHQIHAAAAQPLPPAQRRVDRSPGARQGSLRAHAAGRTARPSPKTNQCAVCHSGPHYTNQQLADVGSGKPTDRSPLVDMPQLTNVVLTRALLARRIGAHARRNLDGLQSQGHARGDQRPPEG